MGSVRQTKRLIEDRARCVLHMQKALTEMNVRLDSVITDITGVTGQRILRAIIDGERDPYRLAELRDGRIKASVDTIAAALQGTWREEHLFALTQAMQRFDVFTEQLETCEKQIAAQIDNLTPPDDGSDGDLSPGSPGASRSGYTVSKAPPSKHARANCQGKGDGRGIAQDDGRRPHRDPDHRREHHAHDRLGDRSGLLRLPVCAALLLVAGIGAGNPHQWWQASARTRAQGGQQGRTVPANGCLTARRSQTFIGARHRARLARKDTPVAITVTARELACLIYTLVTRGKEYVERGIETYEQRRVNRTVSNLGRRAKRLGHQLVKVADNTAMTNPEKSVA